MSIAEDSSTPAVTAGTPGGTQTSVTSASFTPPANSLLVVEACVNYSSFPASAPALTCSDSASGSWTSYTQLSDSASYGITRFFTRPCPTSPGSITVTLSRGSDNSTAQLVMAVRVVTGADLASPGGAQHTSTGTGSPATDTVTTTTTGSLVYVCGVFSGSTQSATAQSGTTNIYNTFDTGDLGVPAAARASSLTGTPGTGSPGALGYTLGDGTAWSMNGLEILPATTTTDNGSVTTAATASAAFGGTHTAFGTLTAGATASAVFSGTGVPVYYVSANASAGGDGTSWATAWQDTTDINWTALPSGAVIEVDGGPGGRVASPYDFTGPNPGIDSGAGLAYSPFTFGTGNVTMRRSRESGRDGNVVIFGGRSVMLPYVNDSGYSEANGAVHGVEDGGYSGIVMDGMDRSGIIVRGCQIGVYPTGTGNTWRNLEITDNGIIAADTVGEGCTDTGGGIRTDGAQTWDRCLVHDNGADSLQSNGGTQSAAGSVFQNSWWGGYREHPRYDYRPFCDIQGTGETTVLDAHADGLQIWEPTGIFSGLTFDHCIYGPGKNQGIYPSDGGIAGQHYNGVNVTNCTFMGVNAHSIISGEACHGWYIDHCTLFHLMGGNELPGDGASTLTNTIFAGAYWLDTGMTWTASNNFYYGGDAVPGGTAADPGFASAPPTGTWAPIATLIAMDLTPSATYASYGSPLHTLSDLFNRIDTLNGTTLQSGDTAMAATASAAFGSTATQFAAATASVTSAVVVAGTRTQYAALAPGATASAAFGGTRTQHGVLTSGVTASAVVSGTRTQHGALTPAVTADAVVSGTRTQHGSATADATASAAFAGTRTQHRAVTGAGTAAAVFGAVKSTFRALTAAVTARLTAVPQHARTTLPMALGGGITVSGLSGNATESNAVLSGTVTGPDNGGGATAAVLSGNAVESNAVLGGSISAPDQGGTLTMTDLGGGVTGWTMQNVNLTLGEFNDITLSVTITSSGSALDLTNYTVQMLLKTSAGVSDTDATTVTLSSTGASPAITITDAVNGACTVAIPRADMDETLTFYRIDAVDGSGDINTAIYGNITYTSL